uniref:N-lysine methyltransferase SETD6 n=1 Tax=Spermophilus dauricus TaxID=99837 RepID=A0A8C9UTV0_SPEDA
MEIGQRGCSAGSGASWGTPLSNKRANSPNRTNHGRTALGTGGRDPGHPRGEPANRQPPRPRKEPRFCNRTQTSTAGSLGSRGQTESKQRRVQAPDGWGQACTRVARLLNPIGNRSYGRSGNKRKPSLLFGADAKTRPPWFRHVQPAGLGWVPLLLALLHELQAPASLWSPYFALWPELDRLEHPMFWPEEERQRLLQGTGVPEAVEKDLANIRSEFYSIVLPFMEAHPDLFGPSVRSLELYHQLVALVMAYSFQEPLEEEEDEKEPNSPLMVPAADILNHLANHNANLEYSADYLRMVATRPIPKGQEIFNTYGQMANWQLIHMYGFVEPYPDNTDDTADIQMVTVREAAVRGTKGEAERLQLYERWDFLCKLEMVGEEGAFVIGREEVLTEEELAATLKVLCMPAEEFREFKDRDGWGEDEWEEDRLTVTNIPKLKASWRQLLRDSVLLTLQTYATDLKTEEDVLSNKEAYAKLSWREKQALQVRYGQKMILHQLLELTS